jgi:hypothetical protein
MRILAVSLVGLVAGCVGVLPPPEMKGALHAETLPLGLGACVQRVLLAHAGHYATCDVVGIKEWQPLPTAKHMHQVSDGECTIVDAYTGTCADN